MKNVTKLVMMLIFCILIVNSLIVSSQYVMCSSNTELKVELMHSPKIVHLYGSDLTADNEPASLCDLEKRTGKCECCSSCTDIEIQNENILAKKVEALLSLPSSYIKNDELVATSTQPYKQVNNNKSIDYFPNLTVLRI